jgi:hypothetical protein
MFGYILPDKPNMYVKDYNLYRAHYCGLCITTRKLYGNLARFLINYDITFLDILIHGLKGEKAGFREGTCVLNPVRKKAIAETDATSSEMIHLNVLLAEFKNKDDISDAPGIKNQLKKLFLRRKIKKARKALPEIALILDKAFCDEEILEKAETASIDRAADAFSEAMSNIFKVLLKEKYTEHIGVIAYNLAKFVYLLDAVDDYEFDVKRGEYNVFRYIYPQARTKSELLDAASEELKAVINGILNSIREEYRNVEITVNEGIVTNTLWFGLSARADVVMNKENTKCQKTRF